MARKKKHPEHVNHERWLVSYADFITLLFAFFVVMFAVSQVDTKKMGHFTEAFSKAVGIDVFPMSGESVLAGGTSADDEQKDTTTEQAAVIEMNALRSKLTSMTQAGDALKGLQIIPVGNTLVLRLPENVFFDTGDATLKDSANGALKLVAPELSDRNVEVRVEGHTDDRPIVSGRYRSNWELSTARAISVMTVLADAGMPLARVSIAGYAEYRPVAPNDSEDGRRQNRRVDLVINPIAAPKAPEAEPEP